MLRPGTKYGIRFPKVGPPPRRSELGVQWCAYSEPEDVIGDSARPLCDSEPLTLVGTNVTKSRVSFLVVPSLPWSPKLVTNLELVLPPSSGGGDSADGDRAVYLRVTTTQSGREPVIVQMRGRPWYIHSTDLWEEPLYEYFSRIIDPDKPAPETCLRIVDRATGHDVRRPRPLGPSAPPWLRRNERQPSVLG
jgi:hypothetical protein